MSAGLVAYQPIWGRQVIVLILCTDGVTPLGKSVGRLRQKKEPS